VILGGLVAVAVARRRRAGRPTRAPARPAAAAAPVHPLPVRRPPPEPDRTPVSAPVAVIDGATALAPAPLQRPAPAARPALHLVAAALPEPEPLPEPLFEPERAPELAPARWETCRVRLWRGYLSWQLVAESSKTASTVALSPMFRARRAKDVPSPAPAENEAARRAVEALQAMLESHGWHRVGDGDAWYEGRFRRPT
jgi:hypothetical protein